MVFLVQERTVGLCILFGGLLLGIERNLFFFSGVWLNCCWLFQAARTRGVVAPLAANELGTGAFFFFPRTSPSRSFGFTFSQEMVVCQSSFMGAQPAEGPVMRFLYRRKGGC